MTERLTDKVINAVKESTFNTYFIESLDVIVMTKKTLNGNEHIKLNTKTKYNYMCKRCKHKLL